MTTAVRAKDLEALVVGVTLLGSGRVAVVDTVTLQEIDVSGDRNKLVIAPHVIAAPKGVAVDPELHSAVLTDPIDIRGTVKISDLAIWKLELISLSNGDVIRLPTTADTGKDVASDVLAKIDPSQYASGFYRLLLTAEDKNGNTFVDASVFIDLEAKPTYK